MDLELKDKIAVITGGSKGIGLGVARAFAREGAHLVITARTKADVEKAAADINGEFGVNVTPVASDVATADGCNAVIAAAEAAGGADIFISNAGTGTDETVADAPDEKWQYFWDLHVMASVRISRALALQMERKGGGAMINIASICAVQPSGYEPIYNTTKAALMMFSKCLSNELISKNIRVNTVNPGLIQTPDWEARAQREHEGKDWQSFLDNIAAELAPIKRFASVKEVADFCVFLSSPRASYIVGSALHIDGGWLNTV
jgi:NAD(P)-dependent dehydrogenase (short-subunit alcohol dehydrogenase family)